MFINYLFRKHWIAPVVLLLLILAAYANSLSVPFLWDDIETVVNNPLIRSWENLPHIFSASVFGNVASGNDFYRPLVTLSFLLNYQLAALEPLTYHLTNIALHFGCTILLFSILPYLKLTKPQALFVSAVFAVHPIGIEVVTFVSGRSDAIASFFMLLTIYSYLQKQPWWQLLTIASLLAALLSKESAVTIPPLLLLASYFFPEHRSKAQWSTAIFLFIIATAYAGLRIAGMSYDGTGSLSWIAQASLGERLLTQPYIFLSYLRIALWPHPLHMEYHTVITPLTHWSIWLGIPILIALLFFGFQLGTKNQEPGTHRFWLLWFIIGLAPVLNIIAPQTSTLREHWLYLPAIGLFVLIAKLPLWKKAEPDNLFIAAVAVVTAFGLLTYQRNRDWQEPAKLYAHDVQLEPRSFVLWNNLGTEYYNAGNIAGAEEAFSNAITQSPNQSYSTAHNNLGVIKQNQGNYTAALELYLRSIALTQYKLAYQNAIGLLSQLGETEKAEQLRQEARQVHPFTQFP